MNTKRKYPAKGVTVDSTDDPLRVNKAINMAEYLYDPTTDRTFDIISWRPDVTMGQCVTVTIEAIVRMPRGENSQGGE